MRLDLFVTATWYKNQWILRLTSVTDRYKAKRLTNQQKAVENAPCQSTLFLIKPYNWEIAR
jgi:hypothetical protein